MPVHPVIKYKTIKQVRNNSQSITRKLLVQAIKEIFCHHSKFWFSILREKHKQKGDEGYRERHECANGINEPKVTRWLIETKDTGH